MILRAEINFICAFLQCLGEQAELQSCRRGMITHSQNSRELEVEVLLSDGLGLGHGLSESVRRVGHP